MDGAACPLHALEAISQMSDDPLISCPLWLAEHPGRTPESSATKALSYTTPGDVIMVEPSLTSTVTVHYKEQDASHKLKNLVLQGLSLGKKEGFAPK